MRQLPRFTFVLAVMLGALALPTVGFASLPLPLAEPGDITELAAKAQTIVIGRCIGAHADWDASGRLIHTTATYEVERWVKGAQPLAQVNVRLLGGTVGDITQVAVGAPVAQVGERVVLFLAPGSDGFALVGWNRGKLPLTRSAAGTDVIDATGSDTAPLALRRTPPVADRERTPQLSIPVQMLDHVVRQAAEAEAGR